MKLVLTLATLTLLSADPLFAIGVTGSCQPSGEENGVEGTPAEPLTTGEKDALRLGVQQCWNVGRLTSDALQTSLVVSFEMTEDAKPVASSVRLISASRGNDSSIQEAFDAARRAIVRCGTRGFGLPIEKYDHWREVEITFNPENMRIK